MSLGTATAGLASALMAFAAVSAVRAAYLCLRVRDSAHLAYFNGPWAARLALGLLTASWAAGEITRSGLCKPRALASVGVAEPGLLAAVALLVRSAGGSGLGRKAPGWAVLCIFHITLGYAFLDRGFWWAQSHAAINGHVACVYPLLSVGLVGICHVTVVADVARHAEELVVWAVNEGVRGRVRWLRRAVLVCVPWRAVLLGASVVLSPALPLFDAVVFLAFLSMACCATVALWVLVFFPVGESLAFRRLPERISV